MVGGMDSVAVVGRVYRIVAVLADAAPSDDLIEVGLVAVREVQAWADAQHGALVAKLSADSFVEARVAQSIQVVAGCCGEGDATFQDAGGDTEVGRRVG